MSSRWYDHAAAAVAAGAMACAAASSSWAATVSTSDYIVIATLPGGEGDAFSMSDSEIGAISDQSNGANDFNPAVSPPGSLPSAPSTAGGSQDGTGLGASGRDIIGKITLDGDAAITAGNGKVNDFSNSDVHAMSKGPGSQGSQGVDCAANYGACQPSAPSDSRFNTSAPAPAFSGTANNNGIQGGFSFSTLLSDAKLFLDTLPAASSTLNVQTVNSDRYDDFRSLGAGLHVIDVDTRVSGSAQNLLLQNSNWVIDGAADQKLVFRVRKSWIFDISQARLLLGTSGIAADSVLWLVDGDGGEGSFNFDNAEFYGMSFWDVNFRSNGTPKNDKNEAVWNNVRGCGQVFTDKVNWNNVSMTGCSFDAAVTTVIPLPAGLPLVATAFGLAWIVRRRAVA